MRSNGCGARGGLLSLELRGLELRGTAKSGDSGSLTLSPDNEKVNRSGGSACQDERGGQEFWLALNTGLVRPNRMLIPIVNFHGTGDADVGRNR